MLTLIGQYIARSRGDDSDEQSEGQSGYAGSLLDWSVNYGHGTTTHHEAAREIAQIQEKAEILDRQDNYRK